MKRWLRRWLGLDSDVTEIHRELMRLNREVVELAKVRMQKPADYTADFEELRARLLAVERRAEDLSARAPAKATTMTAIRRAISSQGGLVDGQLGAVVR